MKTMFFTAAIALCGLCDAAAAGALKEVQAQSMALGSLSGVAYYTLETDGAHLVATLASADGEPLRFESILADGGTARISVPGMAGEAAETIGFERRGDVIFVIDPEPATN